MVVSYSTQHSVITLVPISTGNTICRRLWGIMVVASKCKYSIWYITICHFPVLKAFPHRILAHFSVNVQFGRLELFKKKGAIFQEWSSYPFFRPSLTDWWCNFWWTSLFQVYFSKVFVSSWNRTTWPLSSTMLGISTIKYCRSFKGDLRCILKKIHSLIASEVNPAMVSTVKFYDRYELYGCQKLLDA